MINEVRTPGVESNEGGVAVSRSVLEAVPVRTAILISEIRRDITGEQNTPQDTRKHLECAIEWLYRSQEATGTDGSASAYNLVLGWGGAYPETTGYIVPTLYDYAERSGTTPPRVRAESMASWLLTTQLEHGGFPAGDDPGPDSEPSIFNTGQIILGLVRAFDETGDERYREATRRAGEWLVSVQHADGYWDRYDYNDVVHSYSSRVGWALLEAFEATGVEAFRTAGKNNLYWVADQQRENGWFERCGFDQGDDPFLHTLAYTIRGLLEGGLLLDDAELFDRARRSADAFLELQDREGILTGQYDAHLDGPEFYCLTGNAQMAVIWYRLFEETSEERYRRAADETVAFLKRKQRMDGPPEVRGGLKGSHPVWQRYMYLRYPNWATKFLADALLLSETFSDS
jgi:rhamnogalacturonyl hydrolase YesR